MATTKKTNKNSDIKRTTRDGIGRPRLGRAGIKPVTTLPGGSTIEHSTGTDVGEPLQTVAGFTLGHKVVVEAEPKAAAPAAKPPRVRKPKTAQPALAAKAPKAPKAPKAEAEPKANRKSVELPATFNGATLPATLRDLRALTVAQLQLLFAAVTGHATKSEHHAYLVQYIERTVRGTNKARNGSGARSKTIRLAPELLARLEAEAMKRTCDIAGVVALFCEWGFNSLALDASK